MTSVAFQDGTVAGGHPRAFFIFWSGCCDTSAHSRHPPEVTILAQRVSIRRLEVKDLISVTGLIFWNERIKNGTTLTPLPVLLGLRKRRRLGGMDLVNLESAWGSTVSHREICWLPWQPLGACRTLLQPDAREPSALLVFHSWLPAACTRLVQDTSCRVTSPCRPRCPLSGDLWYKYWGMQVADSSFASGDFLSLALIHTTSPTLSLPPPHTHSQCVSSVSLPSPPWPSPSSPLRLPPLLVCPLMQSPLVTTASTLRATLSRLSSTSPSR